MGVEERVKQIIVELLHPDEERITRQARFIDDLGADPQGIGELFLQFGNKFDMQIPHEEAEEITTVGQVIEYIEAHTK